MVVNYMYSLVQAVEKLAEAKNREVDFMILKELHKNDKMGDTTYEDELKLLIGKK